MHYCMQTKILSEELQNDLRTARCLGHLAPLFGLKCLWYQSTTISNSAHFMLIQILGEYHLDTVEAYRNLGIMYRRNKEYDNSLQMLRKLLNFWFKLVEVTNLLVFMSHDDIGLMEGQFDKALVKYQKSLQIPLINFGQSSTDVAYCLDNIGIVYKAQCRLDAALFMFMKSQKIRLLVVGVNFVDSF
ncbi:Nephrocystin-3 [Trichoplax sp. H2]|nr:Nephrocystin-3 [Trichoplax sp. H2]|eukprot:RDD36310.1 Nephrocystin-3 [Trichoplax sp. H2]